MMAALLQQWALFLGAHDYTIILNAQSYMEMQMIFLIYIMSQETTVSTGPAELFYLMQMENLPVTCLEVKRESG